jgi:uncharacterized protein with PhoU and TrkA domain
MARTLQQLKESIETLIEQQGKDAPVAAFIFTQEDVFEMDENCDQVNFPLDVADLVLNEVEDTDYIFQQVFECIDDEIRRLKISKKLNQSQ